MQIRILIQEPEIGKAGLVFLDDQGRGTMPAKVQYKLYPYANWIDAEVVFEKDLEENKCDT